MNLTVLFQVWVVVFFVLFFTHLRHHVITSHKALWVKKGKNVVYHGDGDATVCR